MYKRVGCVDTHVKTTGMAFKINDIVKYLHIIFKEDTILFA